MKPCPNSNNCLLAPRLLLLLVASLLALFPSLAQAEELWFTVQAGSYPNQESASQNYASLAAKLPGEFKKNLRIELVKPYYTVRLGQAAKAEELNPLLAAVKKIVPQATTIKAYLRAERIVKSEGEGATAPAPPIAESKPAPTPSAEPAKAEASGGKKSSPAPAAAAKEGGGKKISIALGQPEQEGQYLVKGFYGAEQNTQIPGETFRWSSENSLLKLPSASKITFHLRNFRPPQATPPLLTISLNEQPMPLQTEKKGDEEVLVVTVPSNLQKQKKELQVAIRCRTFSMKQLGISEDSRNLGVAISRIELE